MTAIRIRKKLGIFHVDCEVIHHRHPNKKAKVSKLLVDSGSEYTWIPETVLKQIGVEVAKKDMPFLMANGTAITRSIGYAILRAGEFETTDEVVFAQPGDLSLLGSRTLEGFGVAVDARKKKLVASGPHLVAASHYPRSQARSQAELGNALSRSSASHSGESL